MKSILWLAAAGIFLLTASAQDHNDLHRFVQMRHETVDEVLDESRDEHIAAVVKALYEFHNQGLLNEPGITVKDGDVKIEGRFRPDLISLGFPLRILSSSLNKAQKEGALYENLEYRNLMEKGLVKRELDELLEILTGENTLAYQHSKYRTPFEKKLEQKFLADLKALHPWDNDEKRSQALRMHKQFSRAKIEKDDEIEQAWVKNRLKAMPLRTRRIVISEIIDDFPNIKKGYMVELLDEPFERELERLDYAIKRGMVK